MAAIQIRTDEWPLLTIQFPAEPLTDVELTAGLGQLGAYPSARQPFATLTDVRQLTVPLTARQRWVYDEWMRANLVRFTDNTIANACVADSPLSRGAVDSVYWRWKAPPGFRMFTSAKPARAWLLKKIRAANIPTSAAPKFPPARVPAFPPACAETIELFDEPAFLVTLAGHVSYANRAALHAYDQIPSWVLDVVSPTGSAARTNARIARVEGEDVLLVIPNEGAAFAGLPPSLERVARLISRGLSDKEISAATQLTLRTVRTYIRRLYQRTGVHSRSELASLWFARRAPE